MKFASAVDFGEWDYGSFGMTMEGRTWSAGSEYRYGFNSQEQDDEVYGNGNLNTAEFWIYDTRIGRRWNLDPVYSSTQSNYTVFINNPIFFIDPLGLSGTRSDKRQAKLFAKAVGGKASKDKNGLWSVDISGSSLYILEQYWVQQNAESVEIDGKCVTPVMIVPKTYNFYEGENYSALLQSVGVGFWDAAMAAESGFKNRMQTWLSSRDSWVHSDEGNEFGKQIADMNLGIAIMNISNGLITGKNIYNEEMGTWDYFDQALNIVLPAEAFGKGAFASMYIVASRGFKSYGSYKSALKAVTGKDYHDHHLLSQAHKSKFKKAGIADINQYCVSLESSVHQKIHSGPNGGLWNQSWDNFFKSNPDASPTEIIDQMYIMMKDFNISTFQTNLFIYIINKSDS